MDWYDEIEETEEAYWTELDVEAFLEATALGVVVESEE
jgi:hypothetical protein